MAGLPLNDAILIENGVVSRVNRIAYAISRVPALADQFRADGVSKALVVAAEAAAENFRVAVFGERPGKGKYNDFNKGTRFPGRKKGESPFGDAAAGRTPNLEGRGHTDPIVRVSPAAKRLIAAQLGVLVAYDRGVKRKKSFGPQYEAQRGKYDPTKVTKSGRVGSVVGIKDVKSTGRAARLKEDEKLELAHISAASDRYVAIKDSLLGAGFDYMADNNLSSGGVVTGFRGYHDQARQRDTDQWAYAKALIRQKYRNQDENWFDNTAMRAAYNAELANLNALRRAGAEPPAKYQAPMTKKGRASSSKAIRPRGAFVTDDKLTAEQLEARNKGRAARAKKKGAKNNPFSDVGDLALTNPGTGVGFLDGIEDSVSGIPVVGEYVAPLIAPALLGAAAAGLHAVAVPRLKTYLPESVQPYSYSIAGAAVALVASVIAGKASDETTKNLAGLIGGAALAFGVGFDVNSALERKMAGGSDKAGDDDFGGLALAGDDYGAVALGDVSALGEAPSALGGMFGEAPSALGAVALGDGMAYQTSSLGFDGATQTIHASYGDASLADAYFSGPDFDASEGEAIMAGASAFGAAAGRPPKLATGARKMQSHYAGRQYHRWGWLIKQISFPALQQVAALPPDERLKVINQLRSQALALVARASEQAKAEALASQPISAAPELAAQGAMAGYDMNGYGALVLAGGGY